MVCRSPQRGAEALAAIRESTGSERVHAHTCDLSDLGDIRRFAREFAGGGHKADTLINNAGGMASTVVRTREGAEQSFATNVLGLNPKSSSISLCHSCLPSHSVAGTYYMTCALLPVMQASAAQAPSLACRVITVSSGGMYHPPLILAPKTVCLDAAGCNALRSISLTQFAGTLSLSTLPTSTPSALLHFSSHPPPPLPPQHLRHPAPPSTAPWPTRSTSAAKSK
jgi:hypothetical protein